ncbi:MAG TPA: methyl-accepting chemotaxis protein [Candidatus Competibacter sp.]|nr:methyl-accepting chemotaxis protein [Candidatus Competibacter sp.]
MTLGLSFAVTAFLIGRLESDMIRQFDFTLRGLVAAMSQDQIKKLQDDQRFKIRQITQLMAASSEQSFANYDYRAVQTLAGLAAKDSDISFVDFRTGEGKSVASAGKAEGHPADRMVHEEVRDGDTKLGEVRVGYNMDRVERQQAEITARSAEELRRLDARTAEDLRRLRWALAAMMVATVVVTSLLVLWLFRKLVLAHLRKAVTRADDIAHGVLESQNDEAYPKDEMGQLLVAMHDMSGRLRSVVGEVRHAADTIGSVASDIAQGNTDIKQRTAQQTSTLHDTAASIQHLTEIVHRNADGARQAEQLVSDARAQAEHGGNVVRQTVEAMVAVNDSSRKIGDIINVVNDIAFQTNLLALNAAVEAARAGEQGRGFAVVAGEVRKLAQRSAEAAREIRALIADSVSKVEEGDRLVNQSGRTLEEIITTVKRASDIVAELATASQEQARGIEQVNQGIATMDQVAQGNAALTEQAAAASESLNREAANLVEQMAFFQLAARKQAAAASLPAINLEEPYGATA